VCAGVRNLGVRQMRKFNSALLGKWCWRMLVDKSGLWYEVLVSRYGELMGRVQTGGRGVSSWLREIARLHEMRRGRVRSRGDLQRGREDGR
jgi:hypothetical protein